MASYSFEVEHAEKWGVNEAIFLHNLIHWLRLNKAERRNVQAGTDGVTRVWSYNTMEAIAKLYPFWKTHQVRYVIDSLRKQEVIVTDKLSHEKFNHTLWFAVTDEAMLELPATADSDGNQAGNGDDARFAKFRKSKKQGSQKPSENQQDDLRNSANGSEDNRNSLIGSDNSLPDVQTASKQPTEKTLNVGEEDKNINTSSLDASNFEAVNAVIEKFGDGKSTRRYTQLRKICRDNNRLGIWREALRSTEKRMRRDDLPVLDKPGAYFCAAVTRQLEDVGIVVPAGSPEERAAIGGLIAASLAAG